jgi:hypothetical protein
LLGGLWVHKELGARGGIIGLPGVISRKIYVSYWLVVHLVTNPNDHEFLEVFGKVNHIANPTLRLRVKKTLKLITYKNCLRVGKNCMGRLGKST